MIILWDSNILKVFKFDAKIKSTFGKLRNDKNKLFVFLETTNNIFLFKLTSRDFNFKTKFSNAFFSPGLGFLNFLLGSTLSLK